MSAFELLKQMKKILLRNSNQRSKLTLYSRQFQPISTRQCSSWVISKFCILPLWRNIKKVAPSYSCHRLDNSEQHSECRLFWVWIFFVLTFHSASVYFPPALVDSTLSWSGTRFSFLLPWQLHHFFQAPVVQKGNLFLASLPSSGPNASLITIMS